MITVFFYGLFMDQELLEAKGFSPKDRQLASLSGYRLAIGARATLLPDRRASSHGTVMSLSDAELAELYSGDGVEDYVPLEVEVATSAGETLQAVTYILPPQLLSGTNSEYASKLAGIARKLDLPRSYVEEIESWI